MPKNRKNIVTEAFHRSGTSIISLTALYFPPRDALHALLTVCDIDSPSHVQLRYVITDKLLISQRVGRDNP